MKNSAQNDDFYNIDDSFPMLTILCAKYLRESLTARFAEAGYQVTHEQWTILVHLAQQDGISQQDLADRYERSKVSALNLLKRLEKKGLVMRTTDPVDGRYNRVYLTAEGRKLQRTLIPLAKSNMAHMSEGISSEDLALLKSTLKKISANIKRK